MDIFCRNCWDDNKRIFISLVWYAAQELRFVSYRECSSYLLCLLCSTRMRLWNWCLKLLVCDMNIFSRCWGDDIKRIFISLAWYSAQELRFVSYRECSSYLLCPLGCTGMRFWNWCLKLRYSLIRRYPYNWTNGWTNGYFQLMHFFVPIDTIPRQSERAAAK